MSNVSRVTPYVATSTRTAVAAASVAARWLTEESAEERRTRATVRERLSQERVEEFRARADERLPIVSVELHLRDEGSLVRAAESLGYRVEHVHTDHEPVRLQSATGQRIAISRDDSGHLILDALGDSASVHDIIRQHTMQCAVEHLAARGLSVRTATLPNGEIQLLAREQVAGVGGAAEIRAQVHADGSATLEVDRLHGGRCQEIVQDLAAATGCAVEETVFKPAAFELPGEPVKPRVRTGQ